MSEIIAGIDGTERGEDAACFAGRLAEAVGASVVMASAFPYDDMPSRALNETYRQDLERDAEAALARARALTGGAVVRTVTMADTSPAHALHRLAEAERPRLVVVGSSHTGRAGRVVPGSTGERLLHGSPCAVAVVPRGYREAGRPFARIGCAVDGRAEQGATLASAAEAARALGAELEVVRCFHHPHTPLNPLAVSDLLAAARAGVEEAVAALPDDVRARAVFSEGDPVDVLVERSRDLDLLFVGSRGYGPVRSVLLGGVSGRLIREAHCPVIVVPRDAEVPLAGLFAGRSEEVAS